MKILNSYLPLCVLIFSLASCSSLSKKDCQNKDMYEYGFEQGKTGETLAKFSELSSACAQKNVILDSVKYKEGRRDGLRQFCTQRNGFKYFQEDKEYSKGVCPPKLEREFLKGYKKGKVDAELKEKKKELKDKLESIRRKQKKIEDEAEELKNSLE